MPHSARGAESSVGEEGEMPLLHRALVRKLEDLVLKRCMF